MNFSFYYFEAARLLNYTTNDNKNIFNKKDFFLPINDYKQLQIITKKHLFTSNISIITSNDKESSTQINNHQ